MAEAETTPIDAYRLSPHSVLLEVFDGTARLLDLAGNFSAVNAPGAKILDEVLRHGLAGACRRLSVEFDVDPQELRDDVQLFLDGLVRQGSVLPQGERPPRPPLWRSACGWLTASLVGVLVRRGRWPRRARAWALLTLAFISTRLLGWNHTLGSWRRHLGDVAPTGAPPSAVLASVEAAVLEAMSRHPLGLGCKERALSCFALVRSAGVPAVVVVGVDLFPLASHAWCESDGQIVGDRYDGSCERYTPVIVYA